MSSTFTKTLFKRSLLIAFVALFIAGCSDDNDDPPVNTPPTITSTSVTASTEGEAYSYTLTANDADGDALTLSAPTLPAWLSFDPASGVLSGTPAAGDVGDSAVVLSVTDGTDTVTQSFTIIVADAPVPNTAPTITSTAITDATEGTAYTYTLTATDAEGDTLTLSATTLPDWLSFDAATGALTGTPATADVGDSNVVLSVSDGTDAVSQSFTISVAALVLPNSAPVITSTALTMGTVGSSYTYTLVATDVDAGDTLSFSSVTLPAWANFDTTTGVLSGTPDMAGDYPVELLVSDGTDSTPQSFTIVVVEASANVVLTIFENAVVDNWIPWDCCDNSTAPAVVTDDLEHDQVVEFTTTTGTVQGFTTRVEEDGSGTVNGMPFDASSFVETGVLQFELKLVAQPTAGPRDWFLKLEGTDPATDARSASADIPLSSALEGHATPVLDTWQTYTFELSSITGVDLSKLDLVLIYPRFGAESAGAVYRVDNVQILASSNVGGGDGGETSATTIDDFESEIASYTFNNFEGGVSTVVANPDATGINTSAQVVRMEKNAGAPFGGSTLLEVTPFALPADSGFTLKVWSTRAVDVLFKLEGGPAGERTATHGGSGWEVLSFDFTGVEGADYDGITFIFDNGTPGNAEAEPDLWTFYYDDIVLVEGGDAGGGEQTSTTIDDFESEIASYTFNNFEGGVSTVVANPDATGINTSAQVVRMEKNAGAPFGGSTLLDVTPFAVPADSSFTLKVWSTRAVDVLFKLEGGPAGERTATHGGSGWEELSFNFTGVEGAGYNGITFIFDNGTPGNAEAEPDLWTFYYDDIAIVTGGDAVDPGPTGGIADVGDTGLVTNGGFESGDLTGWLAEGANIAVELDDLGTYLVKIVAPEAQNPFIKQDRIGESVVTAGQAITVSFDMKGTASDGGVVTAQLLTESPAGVSKTDPLTTTVPPADWQSYSFNVTVGDNPEWGVSLTLQPVCGAVAGCEVTAYFDNVVITVD